MLSRRVHHVAQAGIAFGFGIGPHDTGANKPPFILARRGLADPLIEGSAKAVAKALVQRTRLAFIAQSALVLGNTMGEFVANDVGGPPKVDKDVLVAIAVDHLLTVPEGVVEVLAEMVSNCNGRDRPDGSR